MKENTQYPDLNNISEYEDRLTTFRRAALIVKVGAAVTAIPFVILYFQIGHPGLLGAMALNLIGALMAYGSERLEKRGYTTPAFYTLTLIVVVVQPGFMIFWRGILPIISISAAFLCLALGVWVLPRTRRDMLALFIMSIFAYGLAVFYDSTVTWDRLNVPEQDFLQGLLPIMITMTVLVMIFSGFQIYRNSRSLQVRLLFDFVGTALIAVAIIGGLSIFFSIQSATSDVTRQLQSVTALKSNEVENWVSNLEATFALALRPSELEAVQDVLTRAESIERGSLEEDFRATLAQSEQLQGIWLANLEGDILLAVGDGLPTQMAGSPVFETALSGSSYLQPLTLDNNQLMLALSRPVWDEAGRVIAILGGSADPQTLLQLVEESVLGEGETAESYLIQQDGTLMTPVQFGDVAVGQAIETEILTRLDETADTGVYAGYYGEDVLGTAQWIPSLEVALVTEASQSEAFGNVLGTIVSVIVAAVVAILIGVAIGLYESRTLATPMQDLADVATQVAGGDLALRAEEPQLEEIAVVARSFNSMTGQLQELIGGLEERVAERTQVLETSFEVSRRISRIRDQQELVASVVEEVRSAFDYYYVQIYLLDEARDLLVVTGGTGKAGQILRDTQHSIQKGLGLVGRAAESNAYEIIPDVYENPNWLPNEHLPDTKSEIAVPISIQDRIYGVLDVQHDVQNGLSQTDADLLLSIANQVAIALESARLYERAQRKANQEALINNIVQEIQSTTSVERALQVAVRELGRAVRSPQTQIRLNVSQTNGDNSQTEEELYVGTD